MRIVGDLAEEIHHRGDGRGVKYVSLGDKKAGPFAEENGRVFDPYEKIGSGGNRAYVEHEDIESELCWIGLEN